MALYAEILFLSLSQGLYVENIAIKSDLRILERNEKQDFSEIQKLFGFFAVQTKYWKFPVILCSGVGYGLDC